jgi:uncharacterized protein
VRVLGPAAEVDIGFEPHPVGLARIRGTTRIEVTVLCQRCLETLELRLQATVDLVAMRTEAQATGWEGEGEAIEASDDHLSLDLLVEDELLLALPAFPVHDPGACRPPGPAGSGA